MTFIKVAELDDLAPRRGKVVIIDDHPIALFNLEGDYVAMDNTCPHRGGSLGNGELDGSVVTCPWHGWQFDCNTGEAVENRKIRVTKYAVAKRGDGVYIEWPHGQTVP